MGFVNVKEEHAKDFLIMSIAIVVVSSITVQQLSQLIPQLASVISMVFDNLVAFVAAAALVVALKQIWHLGLPKAKK